MRHKVSGSVAKMAENCVSRGTVRGLANRWFQPLTHVSECGRLAVSLGKPNLSVKRQMRETRHSKRFAVAHRTAQYVHSAFAADRNQGGPQWRAATR
jgi:hypothetical protein